VGNVAEGFSAGQVQLSQTTLEIEGQEEDIDPVSYAKVTFDIGKNTEETVVQELEYSFYDENDQLLDSSAIRCNAESIQATLPVFVTRELRLDMDFVESPGARKRNVTYTIKPETITVSGDASTLKDVYKLTLDRFDLLTLLDGSSTHHYPITVPEGCQNLSGVTRATLEISFKDMDIQEVAATQFRYENLAAEDRVVDILTTETPVTIFGTSEDVAAVTGEELTIVADLSDYGAALGTYTVPARVENTSGRDIGISGSYEVQVTIREPEDTVEEPSED
jgi:YbbR domain-containing protein